MKIYIQNYVNTVLKFLSVHQDDFQIQNLFAISIVKCNDIIQFITSTETLPTLIWLHVHVN